MDKKYKIVISVLEVIRSICFSFLIFVIFLSMLGKDVHIITDSSLFWIILGIWLIALLTDRSVRIIWLEERVNKLNCENYDRIRDNERLNDKIEYSKFYLESLIIKEQNDSDDDNKQ